MKILNKLIMTILFVVVSLNANTVSNLSGELLVDQGALSYSIPLNLPAGTAGVKPEISFVYNSNGANGYFGQGWNITGLSSISRCSSNLYFDGKIRGVKYDNEDNICLDGQRLELISGNKWGYNSEYRTKIDSYSQIIYDGSSFIVKTKDGDIKSYTKENENWLLKTISDRFGNKITYEYNQDEIYLNKIIYSNNVIKFDYEDRVDQRKYFTNGEEKEITKRVSKIIIFSAGNKLREYFLDYNKQNRGEEASTLAQIKECSKNQCLKPLKFQYEKNIKGFAELKDWGNDLLDPMQYKVKFAQKSGFIDLNGDGLVDRFHNYNKETKEYGYWVQLNTGNGFSELKNWGQNLGDNNQYLISWEEGGVLSGFIDLNGDGLPDRIHNYNYETKEYGYWVQLNTGSSFGELEKWGTNLVEKNQYKLRWKGKSGFVDVNGDGLPDRIHNYNYETKEYGYWVQLNTGKGFGKFENWGTNATNDNQYKVNWDNQSIFLDVNGDGLPDRIHHHNYKTNEYGYWVQLNTGKKFWRI